MKNLCYWNGSEWKPIHRSIIRRFIDWLLGSIDGYHRCTFIPPNDWQTINGTYAVRSIMNVSGERRKDENCV